MVLDRISGEHMWKIAAKVEPNRSGASSQRFRLYALGGQPIGPNEPIQSPVSERDNGRYYLLDVARTSGTSSKAKFPYMINKHTQIMQPVSKVEAEAHISKNWP